MKRSGKFYRRNEEDVMRDLGLEPTKNSGSGWIEKEDGQSDHVICQLKSTDASSIRVKLQDIETLEYNANVSKKLPVFALQFLGTGDVFLLVRPEDLQAAARFIETGVVSPSLDLLGWADEGFAEDSDRPTEQAVKAVRSAHEAREAFANEYEERFKKKEKSAT